MAQLPDRGRLLWPVYAEGRALFCAELAASGGEPGLTPGIKLKEVRYSLPLGVAAEGPEAVLRGFLLEGHFRFAKEALLPLRHKRRADERKQQGRPPALRLFEALAKMNDLEQALDVAKSYLQASVTSASQQQEEEAHLLSQACKLAGDLRRRELEARLEALRAELKSRIDEGAARRAGAEGEESGDSDGDSAGGGVRRGRPGEEEAASALGEPPAQRLRAC